MESVDVMGAIARLQAAGRPYALVSVVRAQAPTSAKPGDKAVVDAGGFVCGWVGGGCAQPAVLKVAARALGDGQARLIRIAPDSANSEREQDGMLEFGMACHSGGTLELFIDPVLPRPQLLVVGASPAARALSQLAALLGFAVFVATQGDACEGFAEGASFLEREAAATALRAGAYVVVATQGRRDLEGLRLALGVNAAYIALVASARKAAVLKQSLREGGSDGAAVDAIVAPAGVPIQALTPEEIALSALAGVVAARRGAMPTAPAEVPKAALRVIPAAVPAQSPRLVRPAADCCQAAATPPAAALQPNPVQSCCGGQDEQPV